MKTVIYWFSGTGNSLHVAKALQEGLDDVKLIPIAQALDGDLESSKRVGLVFPVYAWGPPAIVARFIEKLQFDTPDYMFAVATYGGAPGSTMAITSKMLKRRGLVLNAGFSVKMVENYPPMGGAPEEKKQGKINDAAEAVIAQIVAWIRESACGDFGKKNLFFSLIGRMVYPMFRKALSRQSGSKFYADEKCSSCGICVEVCPVKNVQLPEGEKPTWGNRCEQCFACFHWCPEKAVQTGRKTVDMVRYHHPGTSLKDLMLRQEQEIGGQDGNVT
ncbi:MAG: EFR1 family ferrodoxin [Candidatus Aegiribacteria sp.]|nr:EFR1 family ferrodoxin [Candidatus Aegiribacteria sp.]